MITTTSISSDLTPISRLLTTLRSSGVVIDQTLVNQQEATACLKRFLFEELVRARHSPTFDTKVGRGTDLALLSMMFSGLCYDQLIERIVYVLLPLDWDNLESELT